MMENRKTYLIISIVLLVASLMGIVAALFLVGPRGRGGLSVTTLLVGLCSLILIGTLLVMLVTRGYTKTFAEAFAGAEKKFLVGALTVMTAIVMTGACTSMARLGRMKQHQPMQMSQQPFDQRGFGGKHGRNMRPNDQNQSDSTDQNQNQTPPEKNDQNSSTQNTPSNPSQSSETSSKAS